MLGSKLLTWRRFIQSALTPATVISGLALLLALQGVGPAAWAQGGPSHAWGETAYSSYWGIAAFMSTPNPSIASGQWTGGPVGVTNFVNRFIESGPTKACDIDCGLHPYGNWDNASGANHEFVDTSMNLSAGGYYKYYSQRVSGNTWQAVWCYGSPQVCRSMSGGVRDLGVSSLPYGASGGESSGAHWGSITTGQTAQFFYANGSGWINWCYSNAHYQNASGASVSSCSAPYYSWTSSY